MNLHFTFDNNKLHFTINSDAVKYMQLYIKNLKYEEKFYIWLLNI